jgi:ribonuclease HI
VTVTWHLETDASVNPARARGGLPFAGGGVVLRDPHLRLKTARAVELGYFPSATHAEYAALLCGLEIALAEGVRAIFVRTDNRAVAEHYSGAWKARSPGVADLLAKLRDLAGRFDSFELRWAPSSHRTTRTDGAPTADALARKAAGLGDR